MNAVNLSKYFLISLMVFTLFAAPHASAQVPETNSAGRLLSDAEKAELQTIEKLDAQVSKLIKNKEWAMAIEPAAKRLSISERILGEDHAKSLELLDVLALLYTLQKNYSAGESLFKRAIKIQEKTLGPNHPNTARTLNALGTLKSMQRKYAESLPFCHRALKIREKSLGLDHVDTMESLDRLAKCLQAAGKFQEAIAHYTKAIKRLSIDGKPSDNLLTMLRGLASSSSKSGREIAARDALEQALDIAKKLHGNEGKVTCTIRFELADFYSSYLQDHQKAVGLLKQNSTISKKNFGPKSHEYSGALHALGTLYWSWDRYLDAIRYYETSIEIEEGLPGYKPIDAVNTKHNLASVYERVGKLEKSKRLHEECLKLRIARFGEAHNQSIASMSGLASTLEKLGELDRAEELYRKEMYFAEKINDDRRNHTVNFARFLNRRGKSKEAETLLKRDLARAPKAAQYSSLLGVADRNLIDFYIYHGNISKAVEAQESLSQKFARYTQKRIPQLTESQRRIFLRTRFEQEYHRPLSLAISNRSNPRTAALSAGWLLNSKSITPEVLANASLLASKETAPLVEELRAVRTKLANLSVFGSNASELNRQELAELESRQQFLQTQLAKLGFEKDESQLWIPIGSFMSSVPDRSRLISVAKIKVDDVSTRYGPLDSLKTNSWKEERYVAWIVPPIASGNVQCIDLGPAKVIESAIEEVRKEIQPVGDARTKTEVQLNDRISVPLRALTNVVFEPLKPFLKDVDSLIISPDGMLWTIPWEIMLLEDDQYLIEKYRVRYLSSGRELVKPQQTSQLMGEPVVFANPNYDLNSPKDKAVAANSDTLNRSSTGIRFSPLPYSEVEAAAIAPAIEQFAGTKPKQYTSNEALESTFKKLHRPKALVICTHGYFEKSDDVSNPLLRCGLAFAGANNFARATDDDTEDGILTGLEVVGTDLRGTELVVLSACETGIGEISNGEGVVGLRQAFQLAGAQSIVSSLWQVEDAETARLMNLFFDNLAKGKSKSEALRQAQLTRIKARRARHGAAHPFFWAAFTLTGQD